MKTVEIVGTGLSKVKAPYKDEVWGLNHDFKSYKRFDKWFDVHYTTILTMNFQENEYFDFLKANQEKLVLCEPEEYIAEFHETREKFLPKSELYPKEEAMKMFGRYFKSGIDYMIAYAIINGYTDIGLYGVDLSDSVERWEQRRSLEHKIGYAQGLGINIHLPECCPLLKTSYMYGLETPDAVFSYLKEKKLELSQRILYTKDRETYMILSGALQQVEAILNNWM